MKKLSLVAITISIALPFIFNSCVLENCLQFELIEGRAQKPSNIYLLFSVETCSGTPQAGLQAEDFEIYEDGELISIFESDQTILPRPQLYTLATVLLLDMSGSILESETLEPLKFSAKSFVSQVAGENGQEIAIYLFDGRRNIKKLIAFTEDVDDLHEALDSLLKEEIMNDPEYDISTNLNGSVIRGIGVLDAKKLINTEAGKIFAGTLITFTDGTDRAHRFSDREALDSVESSIHSSFTIGLGGEIDDMHLGSLGKSGFAWAENVADLEDAFNQIAEQVKSESEKLYVVGYCTPSRKGEHDVTLQVTGYLGSLSYSFNSDGFEGGCVPEDIVLTTTTTIPELCFIEELYGENSTEVKLLRYFRDNVLTRTPEGGEIFKQYYQWSPVIAEAMKEDDEFKEDVKEMIDGVLELVAKEAE